MAKIFRRYLLGALAITALAALGEAGYRLTLRAHWSGQAAGSVFEIYGVGESTLVGEPFEPKISVPRMLAYMLGGAIAGRTIVIKNLAERGSPLYPQAIAFERAVESRDPRAPGVVLIVSGHNEGILPDVAPDTPPLALLSRIAEKSALLGDVVLALRRRRLISREKSLATYEYYLRRVIETAQQKGLVPILATMASNISRIEPNCDKEDGATAGTLVADGDRLEEHVAFAAARDLYIGGLVTHAHSAALLYYRAGRCEEALGNFEVAREDFWTAVDLDHRMTFGRTTRPQNDLLRRLAREYHIPLVDTVRIFEARSPNGLLGDDLFMDGQHPTLEGYLLMATAYARILAEQFEARISHPLPDVQAVMDAFGYEQRDGANALVAAGSWLIATSVDHPFPRDRMALAAERFRSLIGEGDDFSAWLGIALTQGVLRGGGLRSSPDGLLMADAFTRSYHVPAAKLPTLLARLRQYGANEDIVGRLEGLNRSAIAARNADDWVARVAEIPGVPAE